MVLGMTERTGAALPRRRDRGPAPRVGARVLGALVGTVAALGVLAVVLREHTAVVVHQCVPGEGLAGWLGLRLALLRPDAACPDGALALGADGRHVVGVTVMVALPVLLAHLAGAGIGVGTARVLGRTVRGAVGLVVRVLRRIPSRVAPFLVGSRAPVVTAQRGPHGDVVGRVRWRRGPPVGAFA